MKKSGPGANIDALEFDKCTERRLKQIHNERVIRYFFQLGYNSFDKGKDDMFQELKEEADKYVTKFGFREQDLYKAFRLGLEKATREETVFSKNSMGGK